MQLTRAEVAEAVAIGKERRRVALAKGCREAYGFVGDGEQLMVDGTVAEKAVAVGLNRPWQASTQNPGELGDVGGIEVRSTKHRRGCLVVHPPNPDDAPYVLVICRTPWPDTGQAILAGWAFGSECKRPEYWPGPNPNRPAYFVPQSALHAIGALP